MTSSDPKMQILSLGAGVQSSALLLMSIRGLLPKLDLAVFADTQWEPREVYEHLERLKGIAADSGIQVVTVTGGNLREQFVEGFDNPDKHHSSIPLFVLQPDGSKGMVRRQCTTDYKIKPVEGYIRSHVLNLKPKQHAPKAELIDHWFGISYDEMGRAKRSTVKWKRHVFPFLHNIVHEPMLSKPWRRRDCIQWLESEFPKLEVPRSACIGCPYHSNHEWRRIKDDPEAWADAVEFDKTVRTASDMDGQMFLHRDCVPLDQVDLRTDREMGQGVFSFEDECDGMCGT